MNDSEMQCQILPNASYADQWAPAPALARYQYIQFMPAVAIDRCAVPAMRRRDGNFMASAYQ